MRTDVVIIGGGISGLTAAYTIKKERPDLGCIVLEAGDTFGGHIQTDHHEGFVIEHGPDSFVTSKPDALLLCKELRLENEFIYTPQENRKVFFVRRGRLIALPEGMVLGVPTQATPLLTTPLLSIGAKLRALCEPFVKKARDVEEDESVFDFFERRLGQAVAERIAVPLIGGIYAGDIRKLSLLATFPQFRQMEQRYGSLLLGLMAARSLGGTMPDFTGSPLRRAFTVLRLLLRKPKASGPAFVSFRAGMSTLTAALCGALPPHALQSQRRVMKVSPVASGGYRVELEGGDQVLASQVFFATPVAQCARLLPDQELCNELAAVRSTSTATVVFGFERGAVSHSLNGLGFIAPAGEAKILASTWISSKWEHRAPAGKVLMRAFLGETELGGADAQTDAVLAQMALTELRRLMGRMGEPLFARVYRYNSSSPQPEVGHVQRMRRVQARLQALPGLYLAAGGLDGIGIPDTVKYARAAARQLLSQARREHEPAGNDRH